VAVVDECRLELFEGNVEGEPVHCLDVLSAGRIEAVSANEFCLFSVKLALYEVSDRRIVKMKEIMTWDL
jgi:hypothetical protein